MIKKQVKPAQVSGGIAAEEILAAVANMNSAREGEKALHAIDDSAVTGIKVVMLKVNRLHIEDTTELIKFARERVGVLTFGAAVFLVNAIFALREGALVQLILTTLLAAGSVVEVIRVRKLIKAAKAVCAQMAAIRAAVDSSTEVTTEVKTDCKTDCEAAGKAEEEEEKK